MNIAGCKEGSTPGIFAPTAACAFSVHILIMEQSPTAADVTSGRGWSRPCFSLGVILAIVALADISIYRAVGYAGPAVFFPIATGLLLLGRQHIRCSTTLLMLSGLLLVLCCRMLWSGGAMQIVAAVWLLGAIVMAAQRLTPWLTECMVFLVGTIPGGRSFFRQMHVNYVRTLLDSAEKARPPRTLSILLPAISVAVFGSLFLLANPDLIRHVSTFLAELFERIRELLLWISPGEVLFWCATVWITGGLLNAGIQLDPTETEAADIAIRAKDSSAAIEHSLYIPFRNTLVTLIVLFAAYLIFEFRTLWFRAFEPGFHYSGYAHEGAAWLTVALGLTTLTLSLIFRGTMIHDSRLPILRRYAWIWSCLNFLLAAAVYNRLLIYVDFNGMTRMRVVGFLGISAVIGGLILVLWKIVYQHNFRWLIRRQMCVPVFAVYLYMVVPVDILVHRYNVSRILAGSPEPCVQISEHPISEDAMPQLLPLLNSQDPLIRDGIRAMLWTKLQHMSYSSEQSSQHWTATQFGRQLALRQLQSHREHLAAAGDTASAQAALQRFRTFAMQWW